MKDRSFRRLITAVIPAIVPFLLFLAVSYPGAASDSATPMPRQQPEMGTLFASGMKALNAAGRATPDERDELLDEAIAAFRKMLVANPSLVRVRLELARAFFLKGEDSLAKRHFEHVLAGKPPAGVVLNINRFLAQIRARKRWSVHVGMALAPTPTSPPGRTNGRSS